MSESTDTTADQAARRKFWTGHMERSYELLQSMTRSPAEECGEGFASIPDAAEEAGIEMLFSTSKIAGDLDRILYIRSGLIPDLMADGQNCRMDCSVCLCFSL